MGVEGTRTGRCGIPIPYPYGLWVRYRPYGIRQGGTRGRADGCGGGQPLTAPAMMPPTICLPKITKTTSSGRVLISAPAMTMLWSGT